MNYPINYPINYDWMATLVLVAALIGMTVVGRYLAFKIPALETMRELNREADKLKLSRKRFRAAVKVNNRSGMLTNVVFFVTILPFCVNLESRSLWRHGIDIVAVLMLFDFMYYLTHRFAFHGKILRKVHSLHHQVRTPTHIDALYVHPLETFIGLALFLGSIPMIAGLAGAPLSAYSMAIATLIFTQGNTINHAYVNLPYFPFKTLDYITGVHASHHIDMNHGNFATLTMVYDRMFGTYEEPTSRATP